MALLLTPAAAQDVAEAMRAALSGDLPRAESLLDPARTPESLMALGLVRQLQLRLDEAGALYQQAAPSFPAEAAFRLGNLELQQQLLRQAAVRYRQALQADPGLLLARYNLAVATGTSPGPYDGKAGWCLVRYPLQTRLRFLELRSDNLIQARWLAQGATTEEQLQKACEFSRDPNPALFLARARVAPERRGVLVWRYLLATLQPTGRDCDLAVWGPGTIHGKSSLTLGVLPDGTVVDAEDNTPLGVRVPPDGHGLHVGPDGTVRVWTRDRDGEVPIGRLALEGKGKIAVGYRLAGPPAWALLPEGMREYCLECPYLTLAERQERVRSVPDRLFVLQELGNLALQSGQRAEAEGLWRRALEVDPGWELTAYNLAMIDLLQHRYDRARVDLERLSGSRVALQERLRLAMLMQNPYEALSVCQAYAKEFPHDPYPAYAAAEILSDGGRLEPALEIVQNLIQDQPELTEPRYLLVALLGRGGRTQAQIEQLQWLLDHDPWPYRAQRLLAANLERLGQAERAQELYRAYLGSFWPILFEPATYLEIDRLTEN